MNYLWWLSLLIFSSAVPAVDHASYLFTDETSVAEGCGRAAERLKMEAVAARCGSQLSGGRLRVQGDDQSSMDRLYFESVAGSVSHYKSIDQTVDMVHPLPEETFFRCRIKAEVEVTCSRGQRDPLFAPLFEQQVSLNQIRFHPGEAVMVEIDLDQPMAITILQLIPYLEQGERVWRLFPNAHQSEGRLGGEGKIIIPDPEKDDYQFVAELPTKESRVFEELVVLATRSPVPFPEKMSVEQFHRLLVEIPLDERRELFIPYEIIQPKQRGVVR